MSIDVHSSYTNPYTYIVNVDTLSMLIFRFKLQDDESIGSLPFTYTFVPDDLILVFIAHQVK